MKGLIWNCRGLGSSDKRRFVRELLTTHKIDFLGIQETQLQDFRDCWLVLVPSRILVGMCYHLMVDLGEYF